MLADIAMTEPELTRRTFIAAVPASRILGANDRVRLGLIGCGGRGTHLLRMAKAAGGADPVAICDAWDQRRGEAAAQIK